MAWLGRRDGSAATNLRLIYAFPEGVEVLGGWAEPWPWHATGGCGQQQQHIRNTAPVVAGHPVDTAHASEVRRSSVDRRFLVLRFLHHFRFESVPAFPSPGRKPPRFGVGRRI